MPGKGHGPCAATCSYLLVELLPVLGVLGDVVLDEPLVLGELELPDVLPEPMLLLPDEPVAPLEELPPVAPLDEPPVVPLDEPPALEPDLLKCASHSERDTMPSLFVSTDEKLGAELELEAPELPEPLAPLDAPPEVLPDDMPDEPEDPVADGVLDEPDEDEPLADGVEDDPDCDCLVVLPDAPEAELPDDWLELEPVAEGDEDEDEDWATARLERAKSTAALSVLTVLIIEKFLLKEVENTAPTPDASPVPACSSGSRQESSNGGVDNRRMRERPHMAKVVEMHVFHPPERRHEHLRHGERRRGRAPARHVKDGNIQTGEVGKRRRLPEQRMLPTTPGPAPASRKNGSITPACTGSSSRDGRSPFPRPACRHSRWWSRRSGSHASAGRG